MNNAHTALPVAATPTRIRTGEWGALVQGRDAVKYGDVVTITTRSGQSWDAVVQEVVYTGPGKWSDDEVTVVVAGKIRRYDTPTTSRRSHVGGGCHTDGECSSMCSPKTCPCGDGGWFRCC